MTETDRHKLLGTYRTPRVRLGTVLSCEWRDCDVIVTGYTDGPVPWPVGRRPRSAARGPVVYGALASAVRRESNQAVAHWWGVGPGVVSRWRKALGVGRKTDGSHRLRLAYSGPAWRAACDAGRRRPEVQAKIAAAMKLRSMHWLPGGRVFTPAVDQLIRSHSPAVAARKTGRTLSAVYSRRYQLRRREAVAFNGQGR